MHTTPPPPHPLGIYCILVWAAAKKKEESLDGANDFLLQTPTLPFILSLSRSAFMHAFMRDSVAKTLSDSCDIPVPGNKNDWI